MAKDDNWGEFKVKEGQVLWRKFGALNIWCRYEGREIHIAYSYDAQNEPSNDVPWSRWASITAPPRLHITALFPDRPVVVKPVSPFWLLKSSQARIYVRIPIWIQVERIDRMAVKLIEVPSVVLSKTWFGTFMEGEACYYISSGVSQSPKPDSSKPQLVICPIKLHNGSQEDLLIEKICLRVDNLSMYYDGHQLWSDETKVDYKGNRDMSQIKHGKLPPEESPNAKRISAPRVPMEKSFMTKTFASLKELPGLGFFN